ncbi:MAG: Rrf2 family transcriptional regulator [Flavihumibacter sp.]|nr:Rrf2 family transcriptional regulator [Flavihumibacter sp.]
MIFSKSFGYAIRGILYIAVMKNEKQRVQLDEMAGKLNIPRHFLGKIMKRMAEEKIIASTKGPYGGFSLNNTTLQTPLISIIHLTDGLETFNSCVLRVRKCNSKNPCPLHFEIEKTKNELMTTFKKTTIADLIQENKTAFIKSIATF